MYHEYQPINISVTDVGVMLEPSELATEYVFQNNLVFSEFGNNPSPSYGGDPSDPGYTYSNYTMSEGSWLYAGLVYGSYHSSYYNYTSYYCQASVLYIKQELKDFVLSNFPGKELSSIVIHYANHIAPFDQSNAGYVRFAIVDDLGTWNEVISGVNCNVIYVEELISDEIDEYTTNLYLTSRTDEIFFEQGHPARTIFTDTQTGRLAICLQPGEMQIISVLFKFEGESVFWNPVSGCVEVTVE